MSMNSRALKIGDHLVSDRLFYDHHGIYAGKGLVVQLDERGVVAVPLHEFTQGWGFHVQNRPARFDGFKVALRALNAVGSREWRYNLQFSNCEHFAVWCETGRKESEQIKNAERAIERVIDPAGAARRVLKKAEAASGVKLPSVATPVLQVLNVAGLTAQQNGGIGDLDLNKSLKMLGGAAATVLLPLAVGKLSKILP